MKQKRLKREDKKLTLFTFAQNIANELELAGRERTKEVYFSAINSFKEFRKGKDITFDMLSNGLMLSYESYLRDKGLCSNTSSFYILFIQKHTRHKRFVQWDSVKCNTIIHTT